MERHEPRVCAVHPGDGTADRGNLIFNFFPPRGSTTFSPVIGINDGDTELFYRRRDGPSLMADRDVLAVLAEELGLAFGPLELALQSQDDFSDLMRDLGWDLTVIPNALASLEAPLATIAQLLDGGELDADSLPAALHAISSALGAVGQIANTTGLPASVDAGPFKAELPRQLVDYLLVEYLLDYQPVVGQLLKLLGVIRLEFVPAAGKRPAFVRREVAWEDLARVLSTPQDVFVDAYQWGQDTFDQETFGFNVADMGEAVGIQTEFDRVPDGLAAFLKQGATSLSEVHEYVVRLPLLESDFGPLDVTAGIGMFPLPPTASEKPGFSFLPYVDGDASGTIQLTDSVAITFEAGVDADGGIGILVRPSGVSAFASILSPPTSATAALALGVVVKSADGSPTVLAGSRDASRLEVRSASVRGGVRAASASGIDSFAEIALQGARIVVKPDSGDADGFLATLLPGDGLTVDLALTVGLSSRQGVYFGGSSGLEIELPAHVELGPIEIDAATIAVRPANGVIPIELGATIKGELGPLQAVVENIGLRRRPDVPAEPRRQPRRRQPRARVQAAERRRAVDRRRRRQGRRLPLPRPGRGRVRGRARAHGRRLPERSRRSG